jgi:hypothetical protein
MMCSFPWLALILGLVLGGPPEDEALIASDATDPRSSLARSRGPTTTPGHPWFGCSHRDATP